MALHYITGQYVGEGSNGISQYDTSLTGLSMLYGVSVSAIQNANFGGTSLQQLYTWLSQHGGERQSADPSVPTGYHWSFQPGMTIEIPGAAVSKSPPPQGQSVVAAGPVTDVSSYGMDVTEVVAQQAGVGGNNLMTFLLLGVAVYFFFGKAGKKGRKRGRRKTKRKTRRRRRY